LRLGPTRTGSPAGGPGPDPDGPSAPGSDGDPQGRPSRPVAAPTGDADYDALRFGVGAFRPGRDVLAAAGPDAVSYLQGQCSNDVEALAEGASLEALLLSPQGRLDALVRVTRTAPDRFVVDSEAGTGPVVLARLQRFRLRTRVEFEPLGWTCLSLRGPAAGDVAVPDRPDVLRLAVTGPGPAGFDLLGSEPTVDGDVLEVAEAAWEAVRIESGIPGAGRELTGSTIAAEAGLVDRTVSFTKGCYTGQELVARLDARGSNVARRLRGLVVTAAGPDDLPPVGSVVRTADGEHEVGKLTSVAWSPLLGAVALATVHRRVVPPGEVVVVRADGGAEVTAEVRDLPLVD